MSREHTPTPWKYGVNVGPTKGLVVEEDGSTILELRNKLQNNSFETNIKHIVHCVNLYDELVASLKGLFENCVMIHKQWGEGCNSKEASAAINRAKAAVAKADGKRISCPDCGANCNCGA